MFQKQAEVMDLLNATNLFQVVKIVSFMLGVAFIQLFKKPRGPIKFRLWTCTKGFAAEEHRQQSMTHGPSGQMHPGTPASAACPSPGALVTPSALHMGVPDLDHGCHRSLLTDHGLGSEQRIQVLESPGQLGRGGTTEEFS